MMLRLLDNDTSVEGQAAIKGEVYDDVQHSIDNALSTVTRHEGTGSVGDHFDAVVLVGAIWEL